MRVIRFVILLLLLSTFAFAQSPSTDVTLKDIHGRTLRLSDYTGKVVLANFWATWCIPCRSEVPDLIKLQRRYRNQGLQVIGISYPPQTLSEVRRFAHKRRINYPVALGTKETKTFFTRSETLPLTVVIDPGGTVRNVIEGIMYADEFEREVKPLLAHLSGSKKRKPSVQKATILVDGHGYRPASVTLRRGVEAQLTFIRKVEATCGREIVIPNYGINQPLPLNTPVVVTFVPDRSGRFKFTCGMDMFRGSLVIR